MNKQFVPFNKRLLIEDIKEETSEEQKVLLPEEYKKSKKTQERYKCYMIVSNSVDCSTNFRDKKDRIVVVEDSMVEEIEFKGTKYKIIQECYVVGMFV